MIKTLLKLLFGVPATFAMRHRQRAVMINQREIGSIHALLIVTFISCALILSMCSAIFAQLFLKENFTKRSVCVPVRRTRI